MKQKQIELDIREALAFALFEEDVSAWAGGSRGPLECWQACDESRKLFRSKADRFLGRLESRGVGIKSGNTQARAGFIRGLLTIPARPAYTIDEAKEA